MLRENEKSILSLSLFLSPLQTNTINFGTIIPSDSDARCFWARFDDKKRAPQSEEEQTLTNVEMISQAIDKCS